MMIRVFALAAYLVLMAQGAKIKIEEEEPNQQEESLEEEVRRTLSADQFPYEGGSIKPARSDGLRRRKKNKKKIEPVTLTAEQSAQKEALLQEVKQVTEEMKVSSRTAPEQETEFDITRKPMQVGLSCTTSKGPFKIIVNQDWSPTGAKRFLEMVHTKAFDGDHAPFYRSLPGELVGFGISGTDQNAYYSEKEIRDDLSLGLKFVPGVLYFDNFDEKVNGRTQEFIITLTTDEDKISRLGTRSWETPIGFVTEGLDVLKSMHPSELMELGGDVLREKMRYMGASSNEREKYFPEVDYFHECHEVEVTEEENKIVDVDFWPRDKKLILKVQFKNSCNVPMNLFWKDSETGEEVLTKTLAPQQTLEHISHPDETFVWRYESSGEKQATSNLLGTKLDYQRYFVFCNEKDEKLTESNQAVYDKYQSLKLRKEKKQAKRGHDEL